tara:strand:- start:337 stop:495 length:159 start_codon:yes stop_codon:yes gene_type:complete
LAAGESGSSYECCKRVDPLPEVEGVEFVEEDEEEEEWELPIKLPSRLVAFPG